MHRTIFAAALLLCAAGPARAGTPSGSGLHLATVLGSWLAAQGNEALRDMREELTRDLERQLKPLLPKPAESTEPAELDPQPAEKSA